MSVVLEQNLLKSGASAASCLFLVCLWTTSDRLPVALFGPRCPRRCSVALAAASVKALLRSESIAAALQIIKMTTETAYDDKAYDQKMKDL